jgi:chemotaxis protein histidine kinase CheA
VGIDPFEQRLAKVRHRFASTLQGKIDDIYTDLPLLSGERKNADVVEVCYRRVHGICGIGPTVGFVQTGRTARDAESVLLEAYRAHRPLTDSEAANFRKKLHVLREAAKSELQTTFSGLR